MEPSYKREDQSNFFKQHQQDSAMANKIRREVLPPILSAREKKTSVSLRKKRHRVSSKKILQ